MFHRPQAQKPYTGVETASNHPNKRMHKTLLILIEIIIYPSQGIRKVYHEKIDVGVDLLYAI